MFERFKVDITLSHTYSFKCHTQAFIFILSKHFFNGNVLNTELGTFLFSSFHGTFENTSRVYQFELIDWRQNVLVLEVRVFRAFLRIVIFYLSVNTVLWLIVHPLTNEEFILVMVEVGALPFT